MTTARVLKGARELLASGWCQGAYARDVSGNRVLATDPAACEHCPLGALFVQPGATLPALDVVRSIVRMPIDHWNDSPGRTKEEVLALFDKAIAKAEMGQ